MSLCERCGNGEYHGYRHDQWPATIYFWCPKARSHDCSVTLCVDFYRGAPKKFDKHGEEIK